MNEAATIPKPVAPKPEPKPIPKPEPKKEVVKTAVEIATAAIATYRREQVNNATYHLSGNEILATVGGSLVAKAFIAIEVEKERGETHTAYLHRKTERNKVLLSEVLQAYADFPAAKIFAFSESDGFFMVVSIDGRKYKVNLKTGTVEA